MQKVNEQSAKSLQKSPGFQIWQLNNQYQRHASAVLQNFGLTYVEFVLMTTLVFDMNKVAANQKLLALRAGTDKNMTSEVLRSLEMKKFIFRIKGIIDGRAITIHASARGVKVLCGANQEMANIDKGLLKQLPGTELAKVLQ